MNLRSFTPDDIPVFADWLKAPHVARWYHEPEGWLAEVKNETGEYDFVTHLIAETDEGEPFGFCQYYDYALGGESWQGGVPVQGTYSIDYLIGDKSKTGRGLGKALVGLLVGEIRKIPGAKRVIVQPEPENAASRNTLLSAGFAFDENNELFIMTF